MTSPGPLGLLLLSGIRHQRSYVPLFQQEPHLRLVALADEPDLPAWLDAANARLADDSGLPYLRDVDEALARDDVDVVCVGSEPTRHAALGARALAAGKHVLVDKPAALTTAECADLESAAARGGGTFSFIHRLYSPAIQRLRTLVDDGQLGVPWAVHVVWLTAGGLDGTSVEAPALVTDRALSGGGELANFLGYPVGTIRYLTGLEVTEVYARTAGHSSALHRAQGVEDFAVLTLTLTHGVLATITVGRLVANAAPGAFTIRVHGSHGTAVADEYRPQVQVANQGATFFGGPDPGSSALRQCVSDFIAAIETGTAPLCGLADARALAAVLEAAYRSVDRHAPVEVAA
jgi:predicted dehydrogenase